MSSASRVFNSRFRRGTHPLQHKTKYCRIVDSDVSISNSAYQSGCRVSRCPVSSRYPVDIQLDVQCRSLLTCIRFGLVLQNKEGTVRVAVLSLVWSSGSNLGRSIRWGLSRRSVSSAFVINLHPSDQVDIYTLWSTDSLAYTRQDSLETNRLPLNG